MLGDEKQEVFCEPSDHPPASKPHVSDEALDRASRLFRALGDMGRLRLLSHLIDGERCVGDLAEAEGEALSTISQRLRILRAENIIVRRRQGKHINYALADRHIIHLVTNALEHAIEPAPRETTDPT